MTSRRMLGPRSTPIPLSKPSLSVKSGTSVVNCGRQSQKTRGRLLNLHASEFCPRLVGESVVNSGRQALDRRYLKTPVNPQETSGTALVEGVIAWRDTIESDVISKGWTKLMKSVNRKLRMTLIGQVLTTPLGDNTNLRGTSAISPGY